jgi:hypothetical protein
MLRSALLLLQLLPRTQAQTGLNHLELHEDWP